MLNYRLIISFVPSSHKRYLEPNRFSTKYEICQYGSLYLRF